MNRAFALGVAAILFCLTAGAVDFSQQSYYCSPNQKIIVSGFQRFARLKNNDNAVSTRYNPTAGAVGYVYSQGVWEVGAAFSWEHGNRRYSGPGGDGTFQVRSETPGVSVFGTMKFQDGWYVDASAFLGFGSYKAHKIKDPAAFSGKGSRVHKTVYAMGLEGGKAFNMGNDFFVTPHIGIDLSHTPSERYNYDGGHYSVKNQTYLEIPIGVSFSKSFNCAGWQIIPKVDLALINSIGGMDTMNSQPGFAYRTADSWKVAGIGGDHIGGRVSAGVNAKMNERTTLGLDYTYEGRKNYNDHRISAMFGWAF